MEASTRGAARCREVPPYDVSGLGFVFGRQTRFRIERFPCRTELVPQRFSTLFGSIIELGKEVSKFRMTQSEEGLKIPWKFWWRPLIEAGGDDSFVAIPEVPSRPEGDSDVGCAWEVSRKL